MKVGTLMQKILLSILTKDFQEKKTKSCKESTISRCCHRRIFRDLSKNGFYLHSDKQWDIKPSSLEKIVEIVDDFLIKIYESVNLLIKQKI